jgi:hypothetical protein
VADLQVRPSLLAKRALQILLLMIASATRCHEELQLDHGLAFVCLSDDDKPAAARFGLGVILKGFFMSPTVSIPGSALGASSEASGTRIDPTLCARHTRWHGRRYDHILCRTPPE